MAIPPQPVTAEGPVEIHLGVPTADAVRYGTPLWTANR